MTTPGTEGYAEAAPHLLATRLDFDAVHAPFLPLIPPAPSDVLDIGAGPGHDAATLAARGHRVVAAEPTPELLAGARALHAGSDIVWLADGLPALAAVRALGRAFDFILMNGVWMHLDERERAAAMPVVASLLRPRGVLALSLRHGWVPPGRRMFEVTAAETTALAAASALDLALDHARGSLQPANQAMGVTWTLLAFRRRS